MRMVIPLREFSCPFTTDLDGGPQVKDRGKFKGLLQGPIWVVYLDQFVVLYRPTLSRAPSDHMWPEGDAGDPRGRFNLRTRARRPAARSAGAAHAPWVPGEACARGPRGRARPAEEPLPGGEGRGGAGGRPSNLGGGGGGGRGSSSFASHKSVPRRRGPRWAPVSEGRSREAGSGLRRQRGRRGAGGRRLVRFGEVGFGCG